MMLSSAGSFGRLQPGVKLDDRDALAKLRGLHRRPLAAGSRPDDNDVVFQIGHAGSIPRGPCLALFLAFPAEGS